MTPDKFFDEYYPFAKQNEIETGVPALVTLAQAALESSWGKSALGNNFFGIKDSASYDYGVQELNTHEYQNGRMQKVKAKFEVYPSPLESFKHHADLLRRRFPKAFKYSIDPIGFITSVQNDHGYKYATDPEYVSKITSIVLTLKKKLPL